MKKNLFKGALASTVIVSLLSFTNVNAQEKKIDIKESKVEWEGEKVTGSHEGTIDLKDGYFTMENGEDRKSTRLNSSHSGESRMPSSA